MRMRIGVGVVVYLPLPHAIVLKSNKQLQRSQSEDGLGSPFYQSSCQWPWRRLKTSAHNCISKRPADWLQSYASADDELDGCNSWSSAVSAAHGSK